MDSELFTYNSIDKIVKSSKCSDIYFDDKTEIPDLPGKIAIIEGKDIEHKTNALHSVLRQIQEVE